MRNLTPSIMNEFIIEKLTNGRLKRSGGISKKYLQDILVIIKSIVAYCEQEYGIANKIRHIKGMKCDKPEMNTLNKADKKTLTASLLKHTNPENWAYCSLYTQGCELVKYAD